MSSALHIHIGGAGTMIGNTLWKLYLKEQPDAKNKEYLFEEQAKGEFPRVLFADLDDRMISQMKHEKMINFKQDQLIYGKEDACTFVRGYYTTGKYILDDCLMSIRKQSETCGKIDKFIITSSISGGTGSGFFSLLINRLKFQYPKIKIVAFLLFPSENMSNLTVDTYNAVLSIQACIESCDTVIMFDNESMYNVLQNQIDLDLIDYSHLNNLISQVISSYTGIERFNEQNNSQIFDFLSPFPKTHFITPSYGPIININDYAYSKPSLKYIFSKNAQLYQSDPKPQYLTSALISRGQNQDPFFFQYYDQMHNIEHKYQKHSQVYLCNSKNYQIIDSFVELKSTQTFFANDVGVYRQLQKLLNKFKYFQTKCAFVHWFVGEGIEDSDFWAGRQHLVNIIDLYEQQSFN